MLRTAKRNGGNGFLKQKRPTNLFSAVRPILRTSAAAAALRDLKLLVGSGGFDFTKGMDSLDKHVEQISFRA